METIKGNAFSGASLPLTMAVADMGRKAGPHAARRGSFFTVSPSSTPATKPGAGTRREASWFQFAAAIRGSQGVIGALQAAK
jgi:hypothetical protein